MCQKGIVQVLCLPCLCAPLSVWPRLLVSCYYRQSIIYTVISLVARSKVTSLLLWQASLHIHFATLIHVRSDVTCLLMQLSAPLLMKSVCFELHISGMQKCLFQNKGYCNVKPCNMLIKILSCVLLMLNFLVPHNDTSLLTRLAN
jgi:NO-binding membrane sensor protein with MHYT domain